MKSLAERLQDVFELAYEDNQPFATKEECIADIEESLNIKDVDFINCVIDNLSMLYNEYNFGTLGMDGELLDLRRELEALIK